MAENKLIFRHVDELFNTREDLVNAVNNTLAWGDVLKPKYAEPLVLKYGDAENPNIVLAVASVEAKSNGKGGKYFFIDMSTVEASLENIKKDIEGDEEAVAGILKQIEDFYDGYEKTKVALEETDKQLEEKIDDLKNKSLFEVEDTDTVELVKTEDETGHFVLSANVRVPEHLHMEEESRQLKNQLQVIEKEGHNDGGLFFCLSVACDKATNKLVFAINGEEQEGIELPDTDGRYVANGKYDYKTEELVLGYNDNSEPVRIPLRDLINEWNVDSIDSQKGGIILTIEEKTDGIVPVRGEKQTQDILRARINYDEADDNLFKVVNGKVFVSNNSKDLIYKEESLESKIEYLDTHMSDAQGSVDEVNYKCDNIIKSVGLDAVGNAKPYETSEGVHYVDGVSVREDIKKLDTNLVSVTDSNAAHAEAISALEGMVDELEIDSNANATKINEVKEALDTETIERVAADSDLDERVTSLEERTEGLSSSLNDVTAEVNQHKYDVIHKINPRIEKLETNSQKHGEDIEVLKSDVKDNKQVYDKFVEDTNESIESINDSLKDNENDITSLRNQVNGMPIYSFDNSDTVSVRNIKDTIFHDVKLSDSKGNIIKSKGDGIYAVAPSFSYNESSHTITYDGVDYPLNQGTLVQDMAYDSEKGEITIYFTDAKGELRTLKFSVSQIFKPLTVNPDTTGAITLGLTKDSDNGTQTLSASVNISGSDDNMLINNNGELIVPKDTRIDTLISKVTALEDTVTGNVDTSVVVLAQNVSALDKAVKENKEDIASNLTKIESNKDAIVEETTKRIEAVNGVSDRVKELEGTVGTHTGNISSINTKIDTIEEKLNNEVLNRGNAVSEIGSRVTALEALTESHTTSITDNTNSIERINTTLGTTNETVTSIKTSLGKTDEKVNEVKSTADSNTAAISRLSETVEKLNQDNIDAKAKFENVDASIKDNHDSIDGLLDRVSAVEKVANRVTENATSITNLKKELDKEVTDRADAVKTLSDKVSGIEESVNSHKELIGGIATNNSAIAKLRGEFDLVKNDVDNLKSTVSTIQQDYATRTELNSVVTDINTSMSTIDSKVTVLDGRVTEVKSSLEGQFQTLTSSVQSTISQLETRINDSISRITERLVAIEGRLDRAENDISFIKGSMITPANLSDGLSWDKTSREVKVNVADGDISKLLQVTSDGITYVDKPIIDCGIV